MLDSREQLWRSIIDGEDGWIAVALAPIAALMYADPRLSNYVPFRSLNRLCLRRRLDWGSEELDLPSLCVGRDGTIGVDRRAYPLDGSADPYGQVGEFTDAVAAVDALGAEAAEVERRKSNGDGRQ